MAEKLGPAARPEHAAEYAALLGAVQAMLKAALDGGERLFTTDAAGLFDVFLGALPADRQRHACAACRRFVDRFGSLAAVATDGTIQPAAWDPDAVPAFYRPAVAALAQAVARAAVTGVHLSAQPSWGRPATGGFRHLACDVPPGALFRHPLLTPDQATAAKAEEFRTLNRALAEYKPALLTEALRLLRADALSRSERFVGPVDWLRGLHAQLSRVRTPQRREAVLWRAVAGAPPGFCSPRASVVGTLLEDMAARLPFAEVKARFDAKLHPLRYQRPQVAPSAGNVAQAEATVAALGVAPSLERRFARLDEVEAAWRSAVPPTPPPAAVPTPSPTPSPTTDPVFGHLRRKASDAPTTDMPPVTVTWHKLARTVLPGARAMEALVPEHGPFIALTTAVYADAPPLLKWDRAERRNPVSWYVYPGGSPAAQWGLRGGTWCRVDAVVPLPTLWGNAPMPFLAEGSVLVLHGAADTRAAGNALFPEHLRAELHGVRRTLEAFSRTAVLGGREAATACGLDLRRSNSGIGCTVRAQSAEGWITYLIDRWD